MSRDAAGLRFSHSAVKFLDTKLDETYHIVLTVTNISRTSRNIYFYQPNNQSFKVRVNNCGEHIAPGIQIKAVVEYSTKKEHNVKDHFVIVADEDVIKIPLLAYIPACQLDIDLEVDFGTVTANNKTIYNKIGITNHGSIAGQFIILDKGNSPISIVPGTGRVQPKTVRFVRIELFILRPMIINEDFLVRLEGRKEMILNVKANIVEQILELVALSGRKLECLQFGNAYYGTTKQRQAVLYNNSPESINWVTVLEDKGVGSEVGADLFLSADAAIGEIEQNNFKTIDETTLVTSQPQQGFLKPYTKTIITLCFYPKSRRYTDFYPKEDEIPKRQDYALYIKFETVHSNKNVQTPSNGYTKIKDYRSVELALTGTGFPVRLNISPMTEFDFSECLLGEKVDVLSSFRNDSLLLPINFQFRSIAHFHVRPVKGTINPGETKNIVISFVPKQIGTFKVKQVIDCIGSVAVLNDTLQLTMQPFHQINLFFSGVCKTVMKKTGANCNSAIPPAVANKPDQFLDLKTDQNNGSTNHKSVSIASSDGTESKCYNQNEHTISENNRLVSFPIDHSGIIRSCGRKQNYRTISPQKKWYTYVDPDYAYTEKETEAVNAHKKYYMDFIQGQREQRLRNESHREFEKFINNIDIGLKPAEGLISPRLSTSEIFNDKCIEEAIPSPMISLTTRTELLSKEVKSTEESLTMDGLNLVPSTPQEKEDCKMVLTPQELHQIIIGPSIIDFGEVCVNSRSKQTLNIVNCLSIFILFEIKITCVELQKTSPLSLVIPPQSTSHIPLIFETDLPGIFQKSIKYTINGFSSSDVLLVAKVVKLALELSTDVLVINPNYGFLPETGFRATVKLYNHRNSPAEFIWLPVIEEKGIAFSIRPDKGFVDAFMDLECEIVWYPSFFSPTEGELDLLVHDGNTIRLKCIAKLGPTNVQFLEKRVLFNTAAWNLSTVKTAIIKNIGQNHAYFKVQNENPLPGLTVYPVSGTIPAGGHTILKIDLTPTKVFKFDIRVKVEIRNSSTLKLRIGGSVEAPQADISVKRFAFPGVFLGATYTIPFTLLNLTGSQMIARFNMSANKDFTFTFEDSADSSKDPFNPHIWNVNLKGKEKINCELLFTPTELASYNFNLPTIINNSPSHLPPLSFTPCKPHDDNFLLCPRLRILNQPNPFRKVQAIALRSPLEMSSSKVEFSYLPGYNDFGVLGAETFLQKITVKNTSDKIVQWKLDLDSQNDEALEEGIFRFHQHNGSLQPGQGHCITICFCPRCPGKYISNVPMFINEERSYPFRTITVLGTVYSPKLSFNPPFLVLNPVPLNVEIKAMVRITPLHYERECTLEVEIPVIELGNEMGVKLLSFEFPDGLTVLCEKDKNITCIVTFSSFKPISLRMDVIFIDQKNNRFKLPVSAIADNCLLTLYSHLALNHKDQNIIIKTDIIDGRSNGKITLQNYGVTENSSHTSSYSSVTYLTSLNEESLSEWSESESREIEVNSDFDTTDYKSQTLEHNKKMGALMFIDANEEASFCDKVVNAVQKWFSIYGWHKGMHSISIPASLRSRELGAERTTIYDALSYLSGQTFPRVSKHQLPGDPVQYLKQLHWLHSTLLTFLEGQGASLAHVRPELLFDPEEYTEWTQLQKSEKSEIPDLDHDSFESASKRAWTDVLLQIYKVFVLSKITQKDINKDANNTKYMKHIPKINPSPLASNVYSMPERFLLTWLNVHYENMRHHVWKDCRKGGIPPMRWIINYDADLLDSLVLAALLAHYCPSLISTHLVNMYTFPSYPEQYLHNSLVFLNALHKIGLNFDIQATDISDPNPVMMLLLCVYLYEKLPNYLPKKSLEFTGTLHSTIVKQIRLKNTSSTQLVYLATIVGKHADDFSLPKGNKVTVSAKSHVDIAVQFRSRFLHETQAVLAFVSLKFKGAEGITTTFFLTAEIKDFIPEDTTKCESPCYELNKVYLKIKNPFKASGDFRVILMETNTGFCKENHLKSITKQNMHGSDPFEGKNDDVNQDGVDDQKLKNSFQATLPEFFNRVKSLHLKANSSAVLEVLYLPFHVGKSKCTICFSNAQIGEFVHTLEGTCCLPLPSALLPMCGPHETLNNCAAAGNYSETQTILYFKYRGSCAFEQELQIPYINVSKEKALAIAAQQQMSQLEYERRKITGTLGSSSVRAQAAIIGLLCPEMNLSPNALTACRRPKVIDFKVETTMPKHFEIPEKISIPVSKSHRVMCHLREPGCQNWTVKDKPESIGVPLKFKPTGPGRYLCRILLHSPCDIRVYNVECVVNPSDNTETEFQIVTPAHLAITKNICIHNETQQEWKIQAILEGMGFYGPPVLCVPACKTSEYPVMFKPAFECTTMGKLTLKNETDGSENVFHFKGIGIKSLAQDHVVIDCQVKKITKKVLMVPNYTQSTLSCKVVSDLKTVSGPPLLTMKAGQIAPYQIHILPWKRGKFKGVISFEITDEMVPHLTKCSLEETDGKEPPTNMSKPLSKPISAESSEKNYKVYRVWFYLEINSAPATPEQCLCVHCAVLNTIHLELSICNPINEQLALHVILNGDGLTGETSLVVKPKEKLLYVAKYAPNSVGKSIGSIIFQSESVGEFWYEVELIAVKPLPKSLPELQCELGKWVRQSISLVNSTYETLNLEMVNSNPGNFTVEIDPKKPLIVAPHSTIEIPVQFSPSALGKANHCGTVTFECPQLEEWIFSLSGIGLLPQPMESVSISALINSHSSIILQFRNPTDEIVLVDVVLTDPKQTTHQHSASALQHSINNDQVFCIPLRQSKGITLLPNAMLDIPLIFSPDEMKYYEGLIMVQIMKKNGKNWNYDYQLMPKADPRSISTSSNGEIYGIWWLYPICGIPEALPPDVSPAVIQCQAKKRIEERVEIILTGTVPGSSATQTKQSEAFIPSTTHCHHETHGHITTAEFLHEVVYDSEDARKQMESSVAVTFVNKEWDLQTGIVTLIFNFVFAPNKPIRHRATLIVQSTTGGVWKFPLLLIATEPQIDDIINIEAAGLHKESVVGFRLTSQTSYPVGFSAYLLPGSSQEFTVSPQAGELLPLGSAGTLITVGFTPHMYSKKYKATLLIQTMDMQWTYEINGLDPQYTPPTVQSSKTSALKPPVTVRQRNFIRENLKIPTTAISSPIKFSSNCENTVSKLHSY